MAVRAADGMDEFDVIARLFRPLAEDAPEALGLTDDAAALPARQGWDLIVTTDTLVEGVHFLPDDPLDLVARKLLRVNLSDLAAKAAEPYGYFLNLTWPRGRSDADLEAFARGLGEDQARFGLKLFGGDTVSTPGPLTVSATLLGWTPSGRMVKRSGARAGDVLLVSETIGDGYLGLKAARGELEELGESAAWLAARYRLPEPRLALREALRAHACAAADVSDGLLADALNIGQASGLGVEVRLDRLLLSDGAARWLALQPDPAGARLTLATGGDDYEIVCAVSPDEVDGLIKAGCEAGVRLTAIGGFRAGAGCSVTLDGAALTPTHLGWRHG